MMIDGQEIDNRPAIPAGSYQNVNILFQKKFVNECVKNESPKE